MLEAGSSLRLRAGQRVVIEPADKGEAAYFAWDVAVQPRVVPVRCWQPVVQSWRELLRRPGPGRPRAARLAAGLAAIALASLPRRTPGSRMAA